MVAAAAWLTAAGAAVELAPTVVPLVLPKAVQRPPAEWAIAAVLLARLAVERRGRRGDRRGARAVGRGAAASGWMQRRGLFPAVGASTPRPC